MCLKHITVFKVLYIAALPLGVGLVRTSYCCTSAGGWGLYVFYRSDTYDSSDIAL